MRSNFTMRRRRSPVKVIVIICLIVMAAGTGTIMLLNYVNPASSDTGNPTAGPVKNTPAPAAPATTAAPKQKTPEELTREYYAGITGKSYDGLYDMLTAQSQGLISREDFTARLQNIYDGIDAKNIAITVDNTDGATVSYSVQMDTLAGAISFEGAAVFDKDPQTGKYLLEWTPGMIFPDLDWNDTVKVKTLTAKRGQIFDCNGIMLAGDGDASSIGLVPGKMRGGGAKTDEAPDQTGTAAATTADEGTAPADETPLSQEQLDEERDADIAAVAQLLDMSADSIHQKLSASWVRDDVFVPLKTVPRGNQDLQDALLQIPGVKITDETVRYYPLAERASHLIGYIQNVNADDLKTLKDKGYNANSVIGRTGLESIYEDQLRARDGYEIDIVSHNGDVKDMLAKLDKTDGTNLFLTIDSGLQSKLYDQFVGDKSCSVAVNPITGAVLALVSTPAYNPNDFILGMSEDEWNGLNDNPDQPLYNRFKAALSPGSTMKPITCAIGLNTGTISPDDDFGPSGLSWQEDGSWGNYYVTTMTRYDGPADIENALVYSDNIFAAKAALKIGADTFASELKRIGFEEKIPFEYGLYSSIISDTESFTSDIQLADSGYGQGEMLMNPVHMSMIYTSFLNNGNILEPQLIRTGFTPEIWVNNAFSQDTASTIKNDLIQVIERGTGKTAKIPGQVLAGKTGTAEIKQTKGDVNGTELGWFVMFTADENAAKPLLITTMVEDVKDRGGSHYVTTKVQSVFEEYGIK